MLEQLVDWLSRQRPLGSAAGAGASAAAFRGGAGGAFFGASGSGPGGGSGHGGDGDAGAGVGREEALRRPPAVRQGANAAERWGGGAATFQCIFFLGGECAAITQRKILDLELLGDARTPHRT